MKRIFAGSGERHAICGTPNGGNGAAPRGSVTTVGNPFHRESLPWTISFPSLEAARASKTTSWPPAKNVTTKKSSGFQWSGKNT